MNRFVDVLVALFGEDAVSEGNYHRGHPVVSLFWPGEFADDPEGTEEGIYDYSSPQFYEDGVLVRDGERPCNHCGLTAEGEEAPDPCLGMIEGVKFACCGHGQRTTGVGSAYVSFEEEGKEPQYGPPALSFFRKLGVGPEVKKL